MNANTTSTRPGMSDQQALTSQSRGTQQSGNTQQSGGTSNSTTGQLLDQAKNVTSRAAEQATEQVRGVFGSQIASGADMVRNLSGAAKQAAQFLDGTHPQFARMIRDAASAADQFSGQMRDTDFDELITLSKDFARRQPALFIGSAFAAGFLLARFAKSSAGARS